MRFFRDKLTGERVEAGLSEMDPSDLGPDLGPAEIGSAGTAAATASDESAPSDPPYQDPFAARGRIKSYPARGPIRRRIWDLEEADGTTGTSAGASARTGTGRVVSRVPALPQPESGGGARVPPATAEGASRIGRRIASRGISGPALAASEGARGEGAQGEGAQSAIGGHPAASSAPSPTPNAAVSAPPEQDVAEARAQLARAAGQDAFAPAAPAAGSARQSARAKTRILGFQGRELAARDPFAQANAPEEESGQASGPSFPVGWIVVAEGPGRGASFTLQSGVSSIGRGEDQVVRLDFGDSSISRQNHASIAYDDEAERFFLGHGGKSNLVRLNGRPVLSTEDLADGDVIRIGETVLRFVALCKDGFAWGDTEGSEPPVVEHSQRRNTMRVDTRPGQSEAPAETGWESQTAQEAPSDGARRARIISRQVEAGALGTGGNGYASAKEDRTASGPSVRDAADDQPRHRGSDDAAAI